jgi:hypothetical protein
MLGEPDIPEPTAAAAALPGAPSVPADGLRRLRLGVDALLDSDAILPVDGNTLLSMLDGAERYLHGGDSAATRGLLRGFDALLSALIDAGTLPAAVGNPNIDIVRALLGTL